MAGELILVIDDEKDLRRFLEKLLTGRGYAVETAAGGEDALARMERKEPALVLLDLKMPGMDGLEVLEGIGKSHPGVTPIMMTAYGTVETAVKAVKLGAYDYITKPFDIDRILIAIDKALEKRRLEEENVALRRELQKRYTFEDIVSKDSKMLEMFDVMKKIADTKSTVLIRGETGTGKELVARALHDLSSRREKPFVPVDCGALTESLLESELFGHVRGAFTGAVADKEGLLETAGGGTAFLDEIGQVSTGIQVKLLRVLQDGEYKRVGDTKSRRADVRLIAATNEDLEKAVGRGTFREDFFYRVNVVPLWIPPLRERAGDIPLLAEHFVARFNALEGKAVEGVSDDTLQILMGYAWPGNVRELENLIHRAVVMEAGPVIEPKDLPAHMNSPGTADWGDAVAGLTDFRAARNRVVESFEKKFLTEALRRNNGNVSRTAQEIGLDRRNIQRKLKQYRVSP
jgi:DNA-binding NtrC family response regulator